MKLNIILFFAAVFLFNANISFAGEKKEVWTAYSLNPADVSRCVRLENILYCPTGDKVFVNRNRIREPQKIYELRAARKAQNKEK